MVPQKSEPQALTLKENQRGLPAVPNAPATPMEMLSTAISSGANMELLERLMSLQERYEGAQARKAFIEAKAAFKAEVPRITKDKDNKQFSSKYTSIGNLVANVNAALSKHGLDARWEIEQGDKIKVTCVLAHASGHSESACMAAPADASGQKNPIQQIKSTITYLKLATYEAVTGVASEEGNADDDGNAAGAKPINEAQLDELIALADSVNANKMSFCKYYKIESMADLPAKQFANAKKALLAKRSTDV